MCSRIVALVLSVTLHILTAKNLYRVVDSFLALSNAIRGWFTAFWYHVMYSRDVTLVFTVTPHILTSHA